MSREPRPFRSRLGEPDEAILAPQPGGHGRAGTLLIFSTLATLTWGAFAFGAVYSWAYVTLALGGTIVGGIGLLTGRRPVADRGLFLGLAAIFLIGLIQLIPLPPSVLAAISPGTDRFLRTYDFRYAVGGAHALSIAPPATVLALGLLAAFVVFLVGLLRSLSGAAALRIARGLALVGAVLALVGIVQKALLGDHAFAGMKIYGLWAPEYVLTTPFGPFVNKNHFAGWMLMTIPLTFGLVMGAIERHAEAIGDGWRQRLVFLSEPDGGRVLMLVFAALLMSLSLIMTRSRSGLGCLVVVAMGSVYVTSARSYVISGFPRSRGRAGYVAVFVLLFLLVAMIWAGADTAVARFANDSESVQLRLRVWRVAMSMARDFPILGTGLDTFGISTIVYQPAGGGLHYQETHNDYLQLLAEGGLALLIAVAVTVAGIVRGIAARFRLRDQRPDIYWLRVGASLGLAAIALQSAVEFSLQMPGNAALFTVLLALALYTPAQKFLPLREPRLRVR